MIVCFDTYISGPLWFTAMRLHAKLGKGINLTKTREVMESAVSSISTELIWKVYLEGAQIEERAGYIERSRDLYVKTIGHCPKNLQWKIWLAGM